ncbi:hypothetical protein MMC13_000986 [Lambiella insularis]|nr:hypothetical protein [Lambiella insularis]
MVAAVQASPVAIPQAVTAIIAPPEAMPAGFAPDFNGQFGIAVQNISGPTGMMKRQISQITDGQIQAPTSQKPLTTLTPTPVMTVGHVSMITDGQIQGGFKTVTIMAVNQISDGQIQQQKTTLAAAGMMSMMTPVPTTVKPAIATALVTSVATKPTVLTPAASVATPAASIAPVGGQQIVACQSSGTLSITLANGILKDSFGRTGYIASNFQFQFDNPPQAGAIFTAGFSVGNNGSLALGGSAVWFQCLSGSFYNLYNKNWAPQCSGITIETLMLIPCAGMT